MLRTSRIFQFYVRENVRQSGARRVAAPPEEARFNALDARVNLTNDGIKNAGNMAADTRQVAWSGALVGCSAAVRGAGSSLYISGSRCSAAMAGSDHNSSVSKFPREQFPQQPV